MPIFDISHVILNSDADYDFYKRDFRYERLTRMHMLRNWLTENVGEYYGSGANGEDNTTLHIGAGWEIFNTYNNKRQSPNPDHDVEVKWYVDITDEQKAILFALKWVK